MMGEPFVELCERIAVCCRGFWPCFTEKPPVQSDQRDTAASSAPTNSQLPVQSAPPPALPRRNWYTALYDYDPRTAEDLRFHAGDQLEVLDQSNPDWWLARGVTGVSAHRRGYIPANYVAPLESQNAQLWFFADTKRAEAEKLLLSEENTHGAFLIRECESQPGELSLSVLDHGAVKHYKIRQLEIGQYFVTKKRSFATLKELVEHYKTYDDGLCVQLGQPCKKAIVPQTNGLSYNTNDQWEIPRSSIKLLNKLGTGQFGEVYEGLWNDTTTVAVKTPRPGSMDPEDFLREAQFMKKLRHPKLIQLYAVCTIGEPIYIITELMRNGSLLDYLRKDKGQSVTKSDQVEMAAQVAAGMAYLELQNYIHRDLAARNVLVGENNVCKVADFGLARVFMKGDEDEEGDEDEGVYEVRQGTKLPVKWTALETLHENKFTIKCDVWSFGILLYEILTYGQIPYPTFSNAQVVNMLRSGYRMPCPINCPKRIYEMMRDCWKETPADRPTFETLQWKLEEFYEIDVSSYDDASRY